MCRHVDIRQEVLTVAKCEWPEGLTVKPDGIHELDACVYDIVKKYRNVTIEVLRCSRCGNEEFVWYRQEDTEEVTDEEDEDESTVD